MRPDLPPDLLLCSLSINPRYIPDETSFEGDTIHDEATESSIAAAGTTYEGVEFVTDVCSLECSSFGMASG